VRLGSSKRPIFDAPRSSERPIGEEGAHRGRRSLKINQHCSWTFNDMAR
jgi:hypothetical protein